MVKTTQSKTIKRRSGDKIALTVKSGETIYGGALVMLDGAEAIDAKTVANKMTVGIAVADAKGGEVVEVETGVFAFANSTSTDTLTKADIGNNAFVIDNQTIAKTDGSSARSIAGTVVDVDADGVWIRINK